MAREVWGGELVEPEDAIDAAGAVVDGESEEFVGLVVARGDGADGFCARERDASARERGRRRDLGEGEKIEGEKLDMGVV